MFILLLASAIACSKPEVIRWPDGAITSSIECVQESRLSVRRTLRQTTITPKSKPRKSSRPIYGDIPEDFKIQPGPGGSR